MQLKNRDLGLRPCPPPLCSPAPRRPGQTSGSANRRDISHSCRSAASVACCNGSIVPAVLSAPNTRLRQPHEQTAWTPPSPSCWIVMEWFTAIGVLSLNDPEAHGRTQLARTAATRHSGRHRRALLGVLTAAVGDPAAVQCVSTHVLPPSPPCVPSRRADLSAGARMPADRWRIRQQVDVGRDGR